MTALLTANGCFLFPPPYKRDNLTSLGTNWFSSLGTISICATVRASIRTRMSAKKLYSDQHRHSLRVVCLEFRNSRWLHSTCPKLAGLIKVIEHGASCYKWRKMAGVLFRETSLWHHIPVRQTCVMCARAPWRRLRGFKRTAMTETHKTRLELFKWFASGPFFFSFQPDSFTLKHETDAFVRSMNANHECKPCLPKHKVIEIR